MEKRYRKMKKKASGKVKEIREGKVLLELPLPIAEVIGGMSEVVEALSREAGIMLMMAVMESESERIAGKKSARDPERTAYRWGTQAGPVYYDSRKVLIDRPRLRGRDNREVELSTYKAFQSPGNMKRAAMRQMILGISSRNYEEAIGEFIKGYGIKKSSVSPESFRGRADEGVSGARSVGPGLMCYIHRRDRVQGDLAGSSPGAWT